MAPPILLSWCYGKNPPDPCTPDPCKSPPSELGRAFFTGGIPTGGGALSCGMGWNSPTGNTGLGTVVHVTVNFTTFWGIPEDVVGVGGSFSIQGDTAYNNGLFNLPCPEVDIGPAILRNGVWELNVVSHVSVSNPTFGIPICLYTYCNAGYYAVTDGTRHLESFNGS